MQQHLFLQFLKHEHCLLASCPDVEYFSTVIASVEIDFILIIYTIQ